MLRQTPAGGNPLAMPCPRCGCPGDYVGHGRYLRHVVHRGREERVEVRRVASLLLVYDLGGWRVEHIVDGL